MDATIPSASSTAPEPAAEPTTAAEGAQLSLKVRTLDQKTYPITICAGASVPQLKERVAVETGITLARQRLIFRGRVLKNDQSLASYSLEDGHVLHLVARAADPNPATASTTPEHSAATQSRGRRGQNDAPNAGLAAHFPRAMRSRRSTRSWSPPPPPRDNDEPDPLLAGMDGSALNNRLMMGATITVPEGADVTMPFLSSMIANIVTSVQGQVGADGSMAAPTSGIPTTGASASTSGRRSMTFSRGTTDSTAEIEAATARALRRHRERRDGTGTAAVGAGTGRSHHTRRSSSADRQASLRSRTDMRLTAVEAVLNDASLDFPPNLQPPDASDTTLAGMQEQVDALQSFLERFGPRLRMLPGALAQRGSEPNRATSSLSTNPPGVPYTPSSGTTRPAPNANNAVTSRHLTSTIETLQSLGEAVDLVARMARHVFVRQAMEMRQSFERQSRTSAERYNSAHANPDGDEGADAGLHRLAREARPGNGAGPRLVRYSEMIEGHPSERPRHSAMTAPAPGSTSSFPVDLTEAPGGDNAGNAAATASPAPAAPASTPAPVASTAPSTSSRSSRSSHRSRRSTANAVRSAGGVGAGPPNSGARISIANVSGLPVLSSVVFPFSLAAGLNGTQNDSTTWNLADLVSRLAAELPAATVYGVLTGDAASVHRVMAHVGCALLSGVDVPRVSRPHVRVWTQDFVAELRRLLRTHALPSDVLGQVAGPPERRSALGDELLRALEPFLPELVDLIFRATSASRAAAFGTTSSTFLGTMARQVVRQLRSYVQGDGAADDVTQRVERVLQGILAWIGLDERMASFAVTNLLAWTHEDSDGNHSTTSARSERSRRRQENAAGRGAADEPASKRRRQ